MTQEQEKLVEDNMKLVYYVYKKVFSIKDGGREREELIQEGMLGLVKASLKYDKSKNITFATFAYQCILRQMQMYLRNNKPRLEASPLSLSATIKDVEGDQLTIGDMVATDDDGLETERQIFDELVLSDKEREVLEYRYMGYKQDEIGKIMGISRQRVSKLTFTARNRWRSGERVLNKTGRPKKNKTE